MRILVTRHGQTNWNLEKRVQGRTDIELNEIGKMQAIQIQEKLQNEIIDIIYCSPLSRAKETANIINEKKNVKIVYDERIIEMCYGELEEKKIDECNFDSVWQINNANKLNGAESVGDVYKRVDEFINFLKTTNDENILIVTHNGICRVLNWYFNGAPKNNNIRTIGIDNCGLMIFELEK